MKTNLIVNVEDKIRERAKKVSAKSNLENISKVGPEEKNGLPAQSSLLQRIKKYTYPIDLPDEKIKKLKEEYMREKYGL